MTARIAPLLAVLFRMPLCPAHASLRPAVAAVRGMLFGPEGAAQESSPDTATGNDIRRFQFAQVETAERGSLARAKRN